MPCGRRCKGRDNCAPAAAAMLLQQGLRASRLTAATYLNQLAKPGGLLQKHKLGKANYYVNQPLYELLVRLG